MPSHQREPAPSPFSLHTSSISSQKGPSLSCNFPLKAPLALPTLPHPKVRQPGRFIPLEVPVFIPLWARLWPQALKGPGSSQGLCPEARCPEAAKGEMLGYDAEQAKGVPWERAAASGHVSSRSFYPYHFTGRKCYSN